MCTKGKIDFLKEDIFDLRSKIGQPHKVFTDFGGRHGFGKMES